MNKILLLLLLAVGHLQAQETAAFNQHDIVALGDIGSIKSSLSDNSTSEAAAKNWAQLSDDQFDQLLNKVNETSTNTGI